MYLKQAIDIIIHALSLEHRVSNSVCSLKQDFKGTLQSIFKGILLHQQKDKRERERERDLA